MKIMIDFGHPAHVHYFRHFIAEMQHKGHTFFIIARDKEVSLQLLQKYKLPYYNRGKGSKGLLGKIIYLIKTDFVILFKALSYKPDLYISFGSPYLAHVSRITFKPNIALADTDIAQLSIWSFVPFSDVILTPLVFKKQMGKRHLFFKGFMELSYLHPEYFKPDKQIMHELCPDGFREYIFFRFVSFSANHDMGQIGFDKESKISIIKALAKDYQILISSETALPAELEPYRLKISPEKIHHVLYFTRLYIGEGATMASECAMLGTPAIYVNSITVGTLEAQVKYGLLFSFRNTQGVLETARELLAMKNYKSIFQERRKKLLAENISLTPFLVWFVENYPDSVKQLKTNAEIQNRFIKLYNDN